MISEKTAELNLTSELLNWLYGQTGRTHYVIAPSQNDEADLGFDASFHGAGASAFIQFKRLHVAGSLFKWKLNRTAAEDQHLRLQCLEALGKTVFYAFPLFSTAAEIASWRRQLLSHTLWVPPSALQPPGGPTGPHDLSFDQASGKWKLASPDPIEIERPGISFEELVSLFRRETREGAAAQSLALANGLLFRGAQVEGLRPPGTVRFDPDHTCASGLCFVGGIPENVAT